MQFKNDLAPSIHTHDTDRRTDTDTHTTATRRAEYLIINACSLLFVKAHMHELANVASTAPGNKLDVVSWLKCRPSYVPSLRVSPSLSLDDDFDGPLYQRVDYDP
jgi:hypothetical protein